MFSVPTKKVRTRASLKSGILNISYKDYSYQVVLYKHHKEIETI